MGVTIHFQGQLSNQASLCDLVMSATAFADTHHWKTESIDSEMVKLLRVRNEEDWDYVGPVRGIALYPHMDSDPVRLEFDRNLYIQEYTKTQFAGVQIHLAVVELLKTIQPYFQNLIVEDEGEYWETGDVRVLAKHLLAIDKMIEYEVRKDPAVKVKVKEPYGRIIDLVR